MALWCNPPMSSVYVPATSRTPAFGSFGLVGAVNCNVIVRWIGNA